MTQDSVTTLEERAILWATGQHTHQLVERLQYAMFKDVGVSYDRFMVLVILHAHGGSAKVSDVADHLNRSANGISMLASRMMKDGLITKARDKQDERIVYLSSTSKGKTLTQKGIDCSQLLIKKLFSVLSDDDVHRLLDLTSTVESKVLEELGLEAGKEGKAIDSPIIDFFK